MEKKPLSQLSDSELEAITRSSRPSLQELSDEELESIANSDAKPRKTLDALPTEERGIGQTILEDYVAPVGKFIDTYTGAPARASYGALRTGKDPIKAGLMQFGEDPELAPTGKELAKRDFSSLKDTAVSDVIPSLYSDTGDEFLKFKRGGLLDPTQSGAAGLAYDIALDPTNVIPVGAIAKGVGKVLPKAASGVGRGLVKGAETAAKGADIVTGTNVATKTLEGAGKASEAIGKGIDTLKGLVTTTAKGKAAKNLATAAENGIDVNILPSTAKYEGLLPRIEQAKAMGIGGEKLLKENQLVFSQFDNAIDNAIEKVGGSFDPVTAGEVIKSGYEKSVSNLFDQNPVRYSTLHKLAPGLELTEQAASKLDSTLTGIEKRMAGLAVRGTAEQKAIAKDLLNTTKAIRKSKNVKQLTEQLGEIGKLGHSPSSSFKLPIDQKEFRNLYGAMRDAVLDTADEVVPDYAKELRAFNKESTEFIKNIEPIQKALESKSLSPEALFKTLTSDSKRLEALFKAVDPETQKALKGAIMSSLVKSGAGDQVLIGRTINALKEAKPRLLKIMTQEELTKIEDLLELGMEMGPRASPYVPQTGVTGLFKDLKARIPEAVADDQFFEALKKRAPQIGNAPAEEAVGGLLKKDPRSGQVSNQMLQDILGQRRGKVERRLKGAQSVAPSTYGEEQ